MLSKFSRANVPLRFTVLIPATQVVPPLGGSYGNTDMWLVRWHMLLRTDPLEYRIPFYFLSQALLSWKPWSEKLSSPPCSRCLISGQYSIQTKAWFFFSAFIHIFNDNREPRTRKSALKSFQSIQEGTSWDYRDYLNYIT